MATLKFKIVRFIGEWAYRFDYILDDAFFQKKLNRKYFSYTGKLLLITATRQLGLGRDHLGSFINFSEVLMSGELNLGFSNKTKSQICGKTRNLGILITSSV